MAGRRIVVLRILVGLLILGAAYSLHQHDIVRRSIGWVERMGPWGPLVYIGMGSAACILFVPSSVVTFAAGVLFGLSRGMLWSLIGNGLGSVCALLIGRHVAREWTTRTFANSRAFRQLSDMVRRSGWKIVVLARLSPVIPFLVGNYAFGLTPISARSYWAASVLGSIPSTAVYAYLGALSRDMAFLGDTGRTRTLLEWELLFGGLMATAFLTFYLARMARRALRED